LPLRRRASAEVLLLLRCNGRIATIEQGADEIAASRSNFRGVSVTLALHLHQFEQLVEIASQCLSLLLRVGAAVQQHASEVVLSQRLVDIPPFAACKAIGVGAMEQIDEMAIVHHKCVDARRAQMLRHKGARLDDLLQRRVVANVAIVWPAAIGAYARKDVARKCVHQCGSGVVHRWWRKKEARKQPVPPVIFSPPSAGARARSLRSRQLSPRALRVQALLRLRVLESVMSFFWVWASAALQDPPYAASPAELEQPAGASLRQVLSEYATLAMEALRNAAAAAAPDSPGALDQEYPQNPNEPP